MLLGFSAFMATKIVVFLAVGALFASLYVLMKQRITIPRFGFVRFVPEKKALRQNWVLLGIGVLVLLLVFAANIFLQSNPASSQMQAWIQSYHMGVKRFYLYALLALVLPALGAFLAVETFIPIMSIGFLMLAVGIWLLANFLKKYPVSKKAGSDARE
jgi:hypothetical protein